MLLTYCSMHTGSLWICDIIYEFNVESSIKGHIKDNLLWCCIIVYHHASCLSDLSWVYCIDISGSELIEFIAPASHYKTRDVSQFVITKWKVPSSVTGNVLKLLLSSNKHNCQALGSIPAKSSCLLIFFNCSIMPYSKYAVWKLCLDII